MGIYKPDPVAYVEKRNNLGWKWPLEATWTKPFSEWAIKACSGTFPVQSTTSLWTDTSQLLWATCSSLALLSQWKHFSSKARDGYELLKHLKVYSRNGRALLWIILVWKKALSLLGPWRCSCASLHESSVINLTSHCKTWFFKEF